MRIHLTWIYANIVFIPSLFIFGLTGCENTLIYGERTGFNLSIHVNDDPTSPLRVNAGLERSVAASVPPTQPSGQSDGEAVNLFSSFELFYTEDPNSAFNETLTVRTKFASGAAALEIARGDNAAQAVSQIVQIGTFRRDAASKTIMCWVNEDPALKADRINQIKLWIEEKNLKTKKYFKFVDDKEFSDDRLLFIQEKSIECDQ